MNLLILNQTDHMSDKMYRVNDARATHLNNILKVEPGDKIKVGMLNGPTGKAIIRSVGCDQVTFELQELSTVASPKLEIDLVCALPRPQTLKKILSISATMGVRKLMLIRSNRVEKSFFDSQVLKKNEMDRFLIEGLAQGMRTRMPLVSVHDRFRRFFEDEIELSSDSNDELRLIADPDAIQTLDSIFKKSISRVVIAIGPEGGWNDFEIDLMTNLEFKHYTLGTSILRVEHAVTAALAQLEMLTISGKD